MHGQKLILRKDTSPAGLAADRTGVSQQSAWFARSARAKAETYIGHHIKGKVALLRPFRPILAETQWLPSPLRRSPRQPPARPLPRLVRPLQRVPRRPQRLLPSRLRRGRPAVRSARKPTLPTFTVCSSRCTLTRVSRTRPWLF